MSNALQLKIIDFLKNDEKREDYLAAEQRIRTNVAMPKDLNEARDAVHQYVRQAVQMVERLEERAGPIADLVLLTSTFATFGVDRVLSAGRIGYEAVLRKRLPDTLGELGSFADRLIVARAFRRGRQ